MPESWTEDIVCIVVSSIVLVPPLEFGDSFRVGRDFASAFVSSSCTFMKTCIYTFPRRSVWLLQADFGDSNRCQRRQGFMDVFCNVAPSCSSPPYLSFRSEPGIVKFVVMQLLPVPVHLIYQLGLSQAL